MAVMLPIMMVAAHGVRIILQPAGQQVGRRLVSVSGDAGIELNASLGQSGPGPTTNASTDQGVHPKILKESSQGSVAAASGADHLG